MKTERELADDALRRLDDPTWADALTAVGASMEEIRQAFGAFYPAALAFGKTVNAYEKMMAEVAEAFRKVARRD